MNKSRPDQLLVSLSVIFLDNVTLNTVYDLGPAAHVKSDAAESVSTFPLSAFKVPSSAKVPFSSPVLMFFTLPVFHTSNICCGPPRLTGFGWSAELPDKQPRSSVMLTKVVIRATVFGAERGRALAADHTRANKQMWALGMWRWCGAGRRGEGRRAEGRLSETGETELHPVGCLQSPLKQSSASHTKSAQCQQRQRKEKPLVTPQGPAGKTAEWTFRRTSERLAVTHTAQPVESTAGQTGGPRQREWWGTVTTCVPF